MQHLINTITCIDALELLRELPDESIHMILTDFPYLITQAAYDRKENAPDYAAIGLEMFRVIKKDGAVITTAAQPFTSKIVMLWEKYFRYEWIWRKTRKTNFLNAKKMPLSGHESILVFGHKLPRYYPQMIVGEKHERGKSGVGKREAYGDFNYGYSFTSDEYYPNTILELNQNTEESNHPNAKPLELWQYLINTYTEANDIVLDPFCGGGVTAIACAKLGRRYICGDSSLEYVEAARLRLQNANPFQDSILKNGERQLSLFSHLE